MNIRGRALGIILGCALAGVLAACVITAQEIPAVDVVELSRIAQEARRCWPDVSEGDYETALAFSITDAEKAIYKSGEGAPESAAQAVRNRDVVFPIESGGRLLGNVLICSGQSAALAKQKHLAAALVLLGFAALGTGGLIYMSYLDRRIMRPFDKMQAFALRIARGELDVPLEMDKGRLFGDFTEAFDIMRAQLAEAREREYKASVSKKELVASLSHDIKTPVTAIKLTSELLLVTQRDEQTAAKLRVISEKADQIDRLVTELFHDTLDELGEFSVTVSEESSQKLAGIIRSADYGGRVSFNNKLPACIITADLARLEQVIGNILTNSYKYAGTDIIVTGGIVDGFMALRFADSGPGVDSGELEQLTNKFYRGGNASGNEGAGLGLYIASSLMERMGGALECRNDNGFTVELLLKLA